MSFPFHVYCFDIYDIYEFDVTVWWFSLWVTRYFEKPHSMFLLCYRLGSFLRVKLIAAVLIF